MIRSCRATVAVLLCLALLLPLASCKDDDGGPDAPTCTGRFVTPVDDALLATATTCNVRWDADLGDAVDIALLKDDQPVGRVAAGAPNTGYYPWIVSTYGQDPGDGYRLRVTAAGDDSCGVTGGPLRLADSGACDLTIVDDFIPSRVQVGTDLSIEWIGTGTAGQVNLDLVHLGRVVKRIGSGLPESGRMTWTTDTYGDDPGTYWLTISDAAIPSCADASRYFTITDDSGCRIVVSTPILGTVLTPGSTFDVDYAAYDTAGDLELALYAGTTRLGTLARDLSRYGTSYAWTVTDLGHGDPDAVYFLRLIDQGGASCYGVSAWFLIRP